mgnify:CR=1 FL=1
MKSNLSVNADGPTANGKPVRFLDKYKDYV